MGGSNQPSLVKIPDMAFRHMFVSSVDILLILLDLATHPHEELQECKTSLENRVSGLALYGTPPTSCTSNVVRVEYDGQLVQFRHKPPFSEWLNRWSMFAYSFESMTMTMTEEYLIINPQICLSVVPVFLRNC